MEKQSTKIQEARLLRSEAFANARGLFRIESWSRQTFSALGLDLDFVQDNQS
jgi:dTDP-4-dehydrorhamnose 3,5-epimerase